MVEVERTDGQTEPAAFEIVGGDKENGVKGGGDEESNPKAGKLLDSNKV